MTTRIESIIQFLLSPQAMPNKLHLYAEHRSKSYKQIYKLRQLRLGSLDVITAGDNGLLGKHLQQCKCLLCLAEWNESNMAIRIQPQAHMACVRIIVTKPQTIQCDITVSFENSN